MSYFGKLNKFPHVCESEIFHQYDVRFGYSIHLELERLYAKMLNESLSKEDICLKFIKANVPFPLIVGLGDLDLAEYMINSGVDVNMPRVGCKALHAACSKGDLKMAELLLQNNADVNGLAITKTPLMSLFYGLQRQWFTDVDVCYQMTRLLLSYGAKIVVITEMTLVSVTMFDAVKCANLDTLKLLVNEAGGDLTRFRPGYDNYLHTCLHCAALNDQPGVLEYVLEAFKRNKIDTDSHRNYHCETPLMVASHVHNHKAVRMLLKSGANFRMKNYKGLTSFDLLIIGKRNSELAWLYFDLGLDVLDRDSILLNKALKLKSCWTKDIIAEIVWKETMLTDQNRRDLILPEKESRYLSLCKEQLSEMHKIKFYNNVSFRDVLLADKTKLMEYAENSDLVNAFFEAKCNGSFPIYCARMRNKLIEMLPRNTLKGLSAYVVSETIRRPIMYEILRYAVMGYMGNDDFCKILICCKAI